MKESLVQRPSASPSQRYFESNRSTTLRLLFVGFFLRFKGLSFAVWSGAGRIRGLLSSQSGSRSLASLPPFQLMRWCSKEAQRSHHPHPCRPGAESYPFDTQGEAGTAVDRPGKGTRAEAGSCEWATHHWLGPSRIIRPGRLSHVTDPSTAGTMGRKGYVLTAALSLPVSLDRAGVPAGHRNMVSAEQLGWAGQPAPRHATTDQVVMWAGRRAHT